MNSRFLLCCSVWLIYTNATNIQPLEHSELPTNLPHSNVNRPAYSLIRAHPQNPAQPCSQWNCSSYESSNGNIYTFLNTHLFFPIKRFIVHLRLHISPTFRYFYFHTDSIDDLSLIRIALKLCNPFFSDGNFQFSDCLPFYAVYIENAIAVLKNLRECCIPFSYQYYSPSSTSISKSASFHLFFILAMIIYDSENGGVRNEHVHELLLHLLKTEICIEFIKTYCARICAILGVEFNSNPSIQYQHSSLDDRFSVIVDFQVIKLVHHYKDKGNPLIAEIMTEVWNVILRIKAKSVERAFSKFHQGLFFVQLQRMNDEIQVNNSSEREYPKCCNSCEVKTRTEFKNKSNPESVNEQQITDQERTPLDYSKPTLDKLFQPTLLIDYFQTLNQLIDSINSFGNLDSFLMSQYHLSWFDSITDNIERAFEQIISEFNPPNDEHSKFIEKFIMFISETMSIQAESYSKNIYSFLKRTESDDEKLPILAASLKTIRMFINYEMFCRKICEMHRHLTENMENTARLHHIITVTFSKTVEMIVIFERMFADLKNGQVIENEEEQELFLGWNKIGERKDANNFSKCSIPLTFMIDICFEECVAIRDGTSTLSKFMQKYKNDWKVLDCLQIEDVVGKMTIGEQSEWLKGLVVFIMEFND